MFFYLAVAIVTRSSNYRAPPKHGLELRDEGETSQESRHSGVWKTRYALHAQWRSGKVHRRFYVPGRYLHEVLETDYRDEYEVVFVWNRSPSKLEGQVPDHLVLKDLAAAATMTPDLIVEVAHPSIVAEYGTLFLQTADFMVY